MILEFIFLYKFFFFCLVITLVLFSISFFGIYQVTEIEKMSAYECGFNPYNDSRIKFEIRFFLIGILFLMFDLEIVFLLPWIMITLQGVTLMAFISIFIFLLILLIGVLLEIIKGALD